MSRTDLSFVLDIAENRQLGAIRSRTMTADDIDSLRRSFRYGILVALEAGVLTQDDLEAAVMCSDWRQGWLLLHRRTHARYVAKYGTEPYTLRPASHLDPSAA